MNREAQFATELRALRALCDEAIAHEQRQGLIKSLAGNTFVELEHQVVFESIRALFERGSLSAKRLRIHLNNRGFPDTDVETYFPPSHEGSARDERAGKPRL
jgi:hypothetical protein